MTAQWLHAHATVVSCIGGSVSPLLQGLAATLPAVPKRSSSKKGKKGSSSSNSSSGDDTAVAAAVAALAALSDAVTKLLRTLGDSMRAEVAGKEHSAKQQTVKNNALAQLLQGSRSSSSSSAYEPVLPFLQQQEQEASSSSKSTTAAVVLHGQSEAAERLLECIRDITATVLNAMATR
jgi:hypothetical protein